MIKIIMENTDNNKIIDTINDINTSSKTDREKIRAICNILDEIEEGYILGLSNNGTSVGLDIAHVGSKWIDTDGGYYSYSTFDIADEIVRGNYNIAMRLFDGSTLEPEFKMDKRYAPSTWR